MGGCREGEFLFCETPPSGGNPLCNRFCGREGQACCSEGCADLCDPDEDVTCCVGKGTPSCPFTEGGKCDYDDVRGGGAGLCLPCGGLLGLCCDDGPLGPCPQNPNLTCDGDGRCVPGSCGVEGRECCPPDAAGDDGGCPFTVGARCETLTPGVRDRCSICGALGERCCAGDTEGGQCPDGPNLECDTLLEECGATCGDVGMQCCSEGGDEGPCPFNGDAVCIESECSLAN